MHSFRSHSADDNHRPLRGDSHARQDPKSPSRIRRRHHSHRKQLLLKSQYRRACHSQEQELRALQVRERQGDF